MEIIKEEMEIQEDEFSDGSSTSFNSKLQKIFQNAQNGAAYSPKREKGTNSEEMNSSASNDDDDHIQHLNAKHQNGSSKSITENGHGLGAGKDLAGSVPGEGFQLRKRSKRYQMRRFNAQTQFMLVDSPEGPRYKCKVCGHLTKPRVSPNTLSQHFLNRHPEMRANAELQYVYRAPTRKAIQQSLSKTLKESTKRGLANETSDTNDAGRTTAKPSERAARRRYNPTGQYRCHGRRLHNQMVTNAETNASNASASKTTLLMAGWNGSSNGSIGPSLEGPAPGDLSSLLTFTPSTSVASSATSTSTATSKNDEPPSVLDDIVFGNFLRYRSMEEFERLERNQNTVFPYFEIALATNESVACKLAGTLSILYAENLQAPGRSERIVQFFDEILRRSRSNDYHLLHHMDRHLAVEELNFLGLLRILDIILAKNGH